LTKKTMPKRLHPPPHMSSTSSENVRIKSCVWDDHDTRSEIRLCGWV
jgi:hypothetical protein